MIVKSAYVFLHIVLPRLHGALAKLHAELGGRIVNAPCIKVDGGDRRDRDRLLGMLRVLCAWSKGMSRN